MLWLMPRKPRIQYPGAIYHLMNRGDRREPIFKDDQDHRRLLETLGQTCQKPGWQVHPYCLMSIIFIPKDSPAGRRRFAQCMEARREQKGVR